MPWDYEEARQILNTYANCYYLSAVRGKGELTKSHRFVFKSRAVNWHIAISKVRNPGAVTAYVNAQSILGQRFPEYDVAGVRISEKYFRGHVGKTGDHGVSASVAALESLNPLHNDVLRLDIEGQSAFKVIVDWYNGSKAFPGTGLYPVSMTLC